MTSIRLLVFSVITILFLAMCPAYAQKETQGYWLNILSYDRYNVASNFKIFNGGVITPGKWIGLGLSIGDLYSTSDRYQVVTDGEGKHGNYGMLSLLTPSVHFIPLARKSGHYTFDGQSMNLLHFYMSYSPWSAVSLSNKETEDIPIALLGRSRIFDAGVAYTFSFASMLPVSVKIGYMNLFNKNNDILAYHFPSNKFNYFYYGLNIALGSWNTGGLHVRDRYTVVPFIANSGRAVKFRSKMNREWNAVKADGSVEAYKMFIRKYPNRDLSDQARIILDQKVQAGDGHMSDSKANTAGL